MGNIFGSILRVATFGESHGAAIGCVIDGCPAGIKITQEDIQKELDKRRPGQSSITTPRIETDQVEILSGVFEGVTLGTPIAMLIRNKDQKSSDYNPLKDILRPGHADYVWQEKYGIRDHRGGGRSSGRETAARVMAGAVAKKFLATFGIEICAYAQQIGPIISESFDQGFIEQNPVRTADRDLYPKMQKCIEDAKEQGDSVGGVVGVIISNIPVGLGEPVFDKLSADLAKAIFSIATVKGVEFGAGFGVVFKKGSENNDPFTVSAGHVSTSKNDAGGINGGISNGQDITIRIAVKPPSSIGKEQHTITRDQKETVVSISGRHDPCIIPRFIPVAESMVALVLADHILRNRSSKL